MLRLLLWCFPFMAAYVYAFRSKLVPTRSPTPWFRRQALKTMTSSSCSASSKSTKEFEKRNNTILSELHIIVLVHGWLGNPKEMDSLKQSLFQQVSVSSTDANSENNDEATTPEQNPAFITATTSQGKNHAFVIHSAEANSGAILTSDGVAAGGRRIAKEIDQVITEYSAIYERSQSNNTPDITLSLVGNSLGGLYCRYAVSEIQALQEKKVTPKFFVTTCTPHLGVSQHTFLTIPTWIESPIAKLMQQTGLDLFRQSSSTIIQDMTIQSKFVHPLLEFQHRIAYANVYGTDFQVPTATAAFWAPTESLHHDATYNGCDNTTLIHTESDSEGNTNNDTNNNNNNNNIVLQLITPPKHNDLKLDYDNTGTNYLSSHDLSVQLDKMGWTKVLVDVRHHLPLSFGRSKTRATSSSSSLSSSSWVARELLDEFTQGRFRTFPLGHTVLVANSKDTLNQYLTQGGKSTMNYLASTMIQQLLLSGSQGWKKTQ